MKKIAFYGGSFNPPTCAHRAIVKHLLGHTDFTDIIVKPCGTRRDKPELGSSKRLEQIQKNLSFADDKYHLDTSGLNELMKATCDELVDLKNTFKNSELWLVCGSDLFLKERSGLCQIQNWVRGKELFAQEKFFIYPRSVSGELVYPPHYVEVEDFKMIHISSSDIRNNKKIDANETI